MQMSDTREIQAAPAIVYAAIQDPETLKACIAGATEVTGTPQDGYTATVVQKVGPVKATFTGHVTMSDMVENRSMTLAGEGKGGVAGFAKGAANVVLDPSPEGGTLLSYEVEAKVGGKLAQLGNRLIEGFAKKMADQFFARLKDGLENGSDVSNPPEAPGGESSGAAQKKTWLKGLRGQS
ncbi:carbon monoxide dehydrogenase [Roseovarius spongiae]|uniref:Carbon monoxide dehydrogenase n=1 Tax=Roseovarius spongiae TaxID=2320272 RepID=A0A3A8B7L2_9RHOB|nr:carbon monoxide dehydrogenase subunit G [Roseovarius spongiae]RKF12701.1 carbon monoxide dehydrogenase [Roseovarius spongiae]